MMCPSVFSSVGFCTSNAASGIEQSGMPNLGFTTLSGYVEDQLHKMVYGTLPDGSNNYCSDWISGQLACLMVAFPGRISVSGDGTVTVDGTTLGVKNPGGGVSSSSAAVQDPNVINASVCAQLNGVYVGGVCTHPNNSTGTVNGSNPANQTDMSKQVTTQSQEVQKQVQNPPISNMFTGAVSFLEDSSIISAIPNWALVGGVAVAAFLMFKGR